ncbi:EthD domain-containing protein [Leucobacter sp. Z1108]|uniref:EthD domain-containing protein n=1 Tax=Leucobacter sp. Z1108 TaxID=3439066 RepID=UPI003F3501F0
MTNDESPSRPVTAQLLLSAKHKPEALAEALQDWLDTLSPTASTGISGGVLSTRIPSAEIDGFARERGWAAAPDVLLQLHFESLHAARQLIAELPETFHTEDSSRRSVMFSNELVQLEDLPERWADGTNTVKMIVTNHPKAGMTLGDFFDHWKNVHGPLVALHGPAMGYRRYAQHYPVSDPVLDRITTDRAWHTPPIGGITEVWWTSYPDMVEGLASESGQEASREMAKDEVNFVGAEHLTAFLATEKRWGA